MRPAGAPAPRGRIEDAAAAIRDQEQDLVDAMMWGTGGLPGLGQLDNVHVVGPEASEHRSGMVSFWIDGPMSFSVNYRSWLTLYHPEYSPA